MPNLKAKNYENFRAALYIRALDLAPLKDDITPLMERFETLSQWIHLGKVYIETHRDLVVPSETTLIKVRDYFRDLGIETSGGITCTINEEDHLKSLCYTNPKYRDKLKEVVTLSARLFDEIIFDDFFFTNCKCPSCIAAKGEKTWTEFRLELMTQASRELVLEPARRVNPNVRVIIKYPNWYEHFQGLGFNLKDQPPLYDGIYTGNETRDAVRSAQHLQPYESYLIYRYYENIKPNGNLGGWVDPFGVHYLDRYAEQLWLTLFAKAPEITLFDYYSIQLPISESQRGSWQSLGTSFNFDQVTAPVRSQEGYLLPSAQMSVAAGAALEQADKVLPYLGNPVGVKSYKPYHSTGEDFLHNYLGMLGIPIDLVPEFPADEKVLLLTESAKGDEAIVSRIKDQLMDGKTVVITTGLLNALQDKGFKDIVEMETTSRKLSTGGFVMGWNPTVYPTYKPILVPVIHTLTNDGWEEIHCVGGTAGTPLFYSVPYGNGSLFVLTIPDNYDDLYSLPVQVLNRIKVILTAGLYVRLEAPPKVSLFVYDNNTFIVESFLDDSVGIQMVLDSSFSQIQDILSGECVDCYQKKAGKTKFSFMIKPHTYHVFRAQ